ncbi:MAG: PorT family protein [Chitinophagia bacterium]|nr:PorT family protein [Chitinophagia bacterium]
MQKTLKTLFLAGILACASLSSNAKLTSPALGGIIPNLDLGIKAGMNYEKMAGGSWAPSLKPGVVIGGYAGIRENVLGFQLEFLVNTAKYTFGDVHDSLRKGSFSAAYFNIPFLLQYKVLSTKLLPGVWLLVGPQYSGLISVKGKDEFSRDASNVFKNGNFVLIAGLEAHFLRFSLGARYLNGLVNLNNDNFKNLEENWSTRTIQVTAGLKLM